MRGQCASVPPSPRPKRATASPGSWSATPATTTSSPWWRPPGRSPRSAADAVAESDGTALYDAGVHAHVLPGLPHDGAHERSVLGQVGELAGDHDAARAPRLDLDPRATDVE